MKIAPLVIVPTYNEIDNIDELLNQILALPSGFDVLVVDDASPDGTGDHVRNKKVTGPNGRRIQLMLRRGKRGLGSAYIDGFSWGLEKGYEQIFQMDADFSHNPDDLERLLEASEDADLVLGTRYIPGGKVKGWPLHRWILSRFGNLYIKMVTGTRFSDLTGGFKCYRADALRRLKFKDIKSEGYTFQMECSLKAEDLGLKVVQLPITFVERKKGKSKIASLKVSFQSIWLATKIGYRRSFAKKGASRAS